MQCRLNHSGKNKTRVEHFATFEKLVFAITSRVLRILMQHIDKFCSLESKLISIQGFWGNPDDGNCLKPVRITSTVRITPTRVKNEFLSRK